MGGQQSMSVGRGLLGVDVNDTGYESVALVGPGGFPLLPTVVSAASLVIACGLWVRSSGKGESDEMRRGCTTRWIEVGRERQLAYHINMIYHIIIIPCVALYMFFVHTY